MGNGSDTTEVVTKYYYGALGATSRLIAFRRAGTLHWAGTDHLGGTIRVLDSSFAAVDGMRYEPYGEDRDSGDSLNTDRKFTGQTEDESIGLYWYQSRAYDPEIGRFVSPDVVVPEPGNPQALNRYSYVYNNPLKYTDPSGHSPEWFNEAWRKEFYDVHGKKPEDGDYTYRFVTMAAATGLKEQIFGPLSHDYDMRFVLPEGNHFDLGANIQRAAELGAEGDWQGFIELVQTHGEWDYKQRSPKFQNFGNFHFGVVASAFMSQVRISIPNPFIPMQILPPPTVPIPEPLRNRIILTGAGVAHIQDTGRGEGIPFIKAPHGDDPKDQAWIELGIKFYHALSTSVVRRAAKL